MMDAARIPWWQRDYCVDQLIDYLHCKRERPWFYVNRPCRGFYAKYNACEFEE